MDDNGAGEDAQCQCNFQQNYDRAAEQCKYQRCCHQHDAANTLHHHGLFDQPLPPQQWAVAIAVLHGVGHFMGRHCDRGDGPTFEICFGQPHRPVVR